MIALDSYLKGIIMLDNKVLTISVAAYNAEQYLDKCLKSICSSSFAIRYCEVIIVNDGSNDRTSEIGHKYEVLYPNCFKVIDKQNGGYGSTVNYSLNVASGKYFKLLDADDWFNSTIIDRFISFLKDVDSDVVFTPYYVCKMSGSDFKIVSISELSSSDYGFFDDLDFSNRHFTMHSITFKTSILKNSNVRLDEGTLYTDSEFVTQPIPQVTTYSAVDLPLYCYRVGRDGQSCDYRQITKHLDDLIRVLNCLIPVLYQCQSKAKRDFISQQIFGVVGQLFNGILLSSYGSYEYLEKVRNIFSNYYQDLWRLIISKRIDIRMIFWSKGLLYKFVAFLTAKRLLF